MPRSSKPSTDEEGRSPFGGKRVLANVIRVRFQHQLRPVECDAAELYLAGGTDVVIKTKRGQRLGVTEGERFRKVVPKGTLQTVVRAANSRDLKKNADKAEQEKESLEISIAVSRELKLDMKFLVAELTADRRKVTLYFSADGRIDFRDLVKELAKVLKLRIEMHQVGLRKGAGMLGGLASCGRVQCCASFLLDFEPVGIKMVKDQGLTLNPKKVSGMCGRLMCCLSYEHETYVDERARMPRRNQRVRTRLGYGKVRDIDVIQKTVLVLHDEGSLETFPLIEVMVDVPPLEDPADDKPIEKHQFTLAGDPTERLSLGNTPRPKRGEDEPRRSRRPAAEEGETEPARTESARPARSPRVRPAVKEEAASPADGARPSRRRGGRGRGGAAVGRVEGGGTSAEAKPAGEGEAGQDGAQVPSDATKRRRRPRKPRPEGASESGRPPRPEGEARPPRPAGEARPPRPPRGEGGRPPRAEGAEGAPTGARPDGEAPGRRRSRRRRRGGGEGGGGEGGGGAAPSGGES